VDKVYFIDSSCDCEKCVSRTTEKYALGGRCLNCGTKFTVLMRKGDKPPLAVDCPNCEVAEFSWRVR
jgi:DNA-directed RNA polymerase subunit RPC12/RpoP